MNRLRNRLLAAFLAAVLLPLALTIWLTASLLDRSLALASNRDIDRLSRALEQTGREYYRQAREHLRQEAESGRLKGRVFLLASRPHWPEEVAAFFESGHKERFRLGGEGGSRLRYMVRRAEGVSLYERDLGGLRLGDVAQLYGSARSRIDSDGRDLRRGFRSTLLLMAAALGVVTVVVSIFFAHRIARPVQDLTQALERLANGEPSVRLESKRGDEIGNALRAFNAMAEQLHHSHQRLIFLTRLSSWQSLGRKMAHELKNSLTQIRLTVEEMAARAAKSPDQAFFERAA